MPIDAGCKGWSGLICPPPAVPFIHKVGPEGVGADPQPKLGAAGVAGETGSVVAGAGGIVLRLGGRGGSCKVGRFDIGYDGAGRRRCAFGGC